MSNCGDLLPLAFWHGNATTLYCFDVTIGDSCGANLSRVVFPLCVHGITNSYSCRYYCCPDEPTHYRLVYNDAECYCLTAFNYATSHLNQSNVCFILVRSYFEFECVNNNSFKEGLFFAKDVCCG